MKFRPTWTIILVVPLSLGCGEPKSGKAPMAAATENRTTGGSDEGSSDAVEEVATPEQDAGVANTEPADDVPTVELGVPRSPDAGSSDPGEETLPPSGDAGGLRPAATEHPVSSGGQLLESDNGVGFALTDVTVQAGLSARQWQIPESFEDYPCFHALYVTGGAAAADIDNDGWIDLFVTRLDQPNLMYLNNRDGTFRDVAPEVGLDVDRWSNGPAFADVDGDSDLDLFVTTAGPAKAMLFINDGEGRFVEEAASRGVDVGRTEGCSELTSATFGDYDHDGTMDLYVSQWTSDNESYNFLFKNDGTGHFTNVTEIAGVSGVEPRGYSSGFMDADGDGWEDLFVVADFFNSQLFRNNRDGTFTNVTERAAVGVEENGMGSALADVNADGHPDWFVSNAFEHGVTIGNRLYINRGNGTFDDLSSLYGITQGGWGWGALLLDIDNDGNLDASNVSGWIDEDERPSLWLGGSMPWRDVAATVGLGQPINGRAYVSLDFDRDGDLDVFVAQNGKEPILYRNDVLVPKHWLAVKARGKGSNTDGIGARLVLHHPDGKVQHRWITGNNNFLGHGPFEAHFGLAHDEGPFSLEISWPASGTSQRYHAIEPDQIITLEEP